MSLTFYFAPMSSASITDAVLAELGVPFDRVTVELGAGGTRKADFLAVNPNGHVPAIVHDGTPIWESAAITIYLGETFGVEDGLFPAPGPMRGEAMKWIVWSNVALAEAASRLMRSLPPGPPGSGASTEPECAGEGAGAEARRDLAVLLKVLDDALAGRSFLLGEYTLVDTHVGSVVGWIGMLGVDMAAHSNVAAWLGRWMARPALAKMMAG